MAKTALRLDTRRVLQDGTFPVQIRVGHGTNLYIRTGIYLRSKDWDARRQICTGDGAKRINNILKNLVLQVNNKILELRESGLFDRLTKKQLRQILTGLSPSVSVSIPTLGAYIDKVRDLKTDSTKISYTTTKNRLAKFCDVDNLLFSEMSYAWFESFIKSLEGLRRNTIAKYLKVIKTVVRYAVEDGIQVNTAYLKVSSRAETDTPLRAMPVETFRRLCREQVKGPKVMYRDAFLLSFCLIGINMVDLLALPKNCISNGRLQYKRAKTGKNYSIKIEPEAWAIIRKYPGKGHLLNFGERVKGFRYNCNAYLNSFEKGLTWYWARYSWANYAVDLDIAKDIISECLGHKHGSNITGIYIRYSLDKIDAANRKVLDYVFKSF